MGAQSWLGPCWLAALSRRLVARVVVNTHYLPRVRAPIHGYNDRCVAARELRLLPLHGAPYWDGLHGKRMASFEDRLQGVPEVVVPHGRRIVVVVVHRAVVAQSAALVEEEDLGSTLGPVGASDFLGLIVEVREIEPLLLGAFLHPGEAISGVLLCIVGADGEELDAAVSVVILYIDQAVLPGSGVGAVVTGEDHCSGFFVCVVSQSVAPIVHARQLEGHCLVARA